MSNYLTVPGTSVRLKDGSVVMLTRFPGTKWIVHCGWYNYNDRSYTGWYFCSIPAQTILPINQQDLQGVVLISDKYDGKIDPIPGPDFPPGPPAPDYPDVNPMPYPHPHPHHPHHHHYGPNPYPPICPRPDVEKPAFFGVSNLKMLNSTFITVSNIKDMEALDTSVMPDGRMICVNSVSGQRKYYRWNSRDDRWDEIDPIAVINDEIDYALQSYATEDQVDDKIETAKDELTTVINENKEYSDAQFTMVNARVDETNQTVSSLSDRIEEVSNNATQAISELTAIHEEDVTNLTNNLSVVTEELDQLKEEINAHDDQMDADLSAIRERLDALEAAVFNIQKLSQVMEDNTLLVSQNGTLKDSGFSIGDDTIGEIADYANVNTVATEKAVAKLVESSQTRWNSF